MGRHEDQGVPLLATQIHSEALRPPVQGNGWGYGGALNVALRTTPPGWAFARLGVMLEKAM